MSTLDLWNECDMMLSYNGGFMSLDYILNQRTGVGASLATADFAAEKIKVVPEAVVRSLATLFSLYHATVAGLVINTFQFATKPNMDSAKLIATDAAALGIEIYGGFGLRLLLAVANGCYPQVVRRHYEQIIAPTVLPAHD